MIKTDFKAMLSGVFSQTVMILLLMLGISIWFLKFVIDNFENLPFQTFCFSLGLLFIVAFFVVAAILAFKSRGQVGGAVAEIRRGDTLIRMENEVNLLQIVLPLILPQMLPTPDGEIEGNPLTQKSIKLYNDEQKKQWAKDNAKDLESQLVALVKQKAEPLILDQNDTGEE
ncbi:MAG: hypothetical protein V1739_00555 [Candidatus Omnitrophota bacterium]